MSKLKLLVLATAVVLTGCASTSPSLRSEQVIAPATTDFRLELNVAKINEMLAKDDLTDEQAVRFMYERAKIYDSLGLVTLARLDFSRVLQQRPDIADAHNYVGIYLTLMQEYSRAYESFDTVLELAPDYEFAYLNRAIALYYANRHEVASEDFGRFHQVKPQDGFSSIWLYLNDANLNQEQAKAELLERQTQVANWWESALINALVGKISQEQLLTMAGKDLNKPNLLQQRACEAYFYLAQKAKLEGNIEQAKQLFKKTLNTAVYDFVEYRYAQLELEQLSKS